MAPLAQLVQIKSPTQIDPPDKQNPRAKLFAILIFNAQLRGFFTKNSILLTQTTVSFSE